MQTVSTVARQTRQLLLWGISSGVERLPCTQEAEGSIPSFSILAQEDSKGMCLRGGEVLPNGQDVGRPHGLVV
jgi:hypothetical protein